MSFKTKFKFHNEYPDFFGAAVIYDQEEKDVDILIGFWRITIGLKLSKDQ